MANKLFNQADINNDQRLDLSEFRNLISQNLGSGASIYTGNAGDGGRFSANSFGSSSSATYGDISGGYGGITDLTAGNNSGSGIGVGGGGDASYNSYQQSSYSSSGGAGGFDTSAATAIDLASAAAEASSSSSFEASSSQQQVQQYATNPQGLYQDPNPQIIRRPAQGGQVTYTQSIKVRFLQPPAIPSPGPLIIKEVRPPQPPPPPPLVVRQRAPPLPQPPPLILREKPPPIPASLTAQTVIRKLAALPVPPRSVIIERLPALPPKPRDIIIERWIPYGAMSKRKTIVQRAEAAKEYPKPRNVIIQYEPIQVRVVRQFQRLGVTQENPQAYLQRYGASLFDAQTLLQQARAAGVIEDISPPNNVATTAASSSSLNAGESSSSSFETVNYGAQQVNAGFSGFESAQSGGGGGGGGGGFSSFESSSFSSQGGAALGNASASGYESYSASGGGGNHIGLTQNAFDAADQNKDGAIDSNEFRQFLSSQLQ